MDENKRLLLKEQDILWHEHRTLMSECNLLVARISYLREHLYPHEYLSLISSIGFLKRAQKENEILYQIKNLQIAGRKRFFKYFNIEETNNKLKKHIVLKRQHRDLIEESLSFSIDFLNKIRQEAS